MTAKTIQFPKMSPGLRLTLCVGLVLLGLYFWLNALIIALVLISLCPAILNTMSILPLRASIMFLLYFVSFCAWATIGWLVIVLALRLRKQASITNKFVIIVVIALVLLMVCHLALKANLVRMIGL